MKGTNSNSNVKHCNERKQESHKPILTNTTNYESTTFTGAKFQVDKSLPTYLNMT